MIRSAILGGLEIPFYAAFDLQQTYEPRSKEVIHEMGDGSLRKQVFGGAQNKVGTRLSGSGPIPPGLLSLDFTASLLLKCAAERAINSASNAITIPAERRADAGYEPWGRAQIDNRWSPTPVAMSTNLATLTPVAGADLYQVLWFPEFQVFVENGGVSENNDLHRAETGWELSMLQI